MIKVLTKKQFRELSKPFKGEGKEIAEPKLQLFPIDKGLINGNWYSIKVDDVKNEVILTEVEV